MWENLPKLNKSEVELCNFWAFCSSLSPKLQAFLAPIEELLTKIVNAPCVLKFKRVVLEAKPEITGSLFAATWPPQAGFFWIELDTPVFQTCVYQTIGQAQAPENPDPKLSDLEQGVALYLLASVFACSKESFQLSKSSELPEGPTLCLSLSFQVGDKNSFVRIWVSKELLASLTKLNAPDPKIEERTSWATLPLKVQLAEIELTQNDLKGLEAGDIILLENTGLQIQDKIVAGEVKASLGEPAYSTLKCQLGVAESGEYSLTIQEIS